MNKTRIEQFFDDHAETLAAYNAKHAQEPDFTFETKVDPVSNYIDGALEALEDEDADPAIEDDFDWLDDEPEEQPARGPRP